MMMATTSFRTYREPDAVVVAMYAAYQPTIEDLAEIAEWRAEEAAVAAGENRAREIAETSTRCDRRAA